MEVPYDFNFSDLADSPEFKRRKYSEFQKPTDALKDDLLPPEVEKTLPTFQEIPHRLSWKNPLAQTSGADDVKSSGTSKPKYMKRSREICKRQDFGAQDILHQYRLSVKMKYESVLSFLCGEQESFSALYTEPVIVQKNTNGSFQKICVLDLFMLFDPITVILRGNSGGGKSIIAQKIMLDWASEAVPAKRFDLVFYLRCEELMCFSEDMNFIELLSCSCSLTTDEISQLLQRTMMSPRHNDVLFIIDGFDELKLTQDVYHHMSPYADPLQKAPAEVIICAMLRGRILPESFLLVMTRTEDTVNKLLKGQSYFTEIMGFYENEVYRYFQKFFLIKAYYSVIANETLFTACSIPAICRIISERVKFGAVTRRLEMTTSIYIDFVCTLLEHHCQGLSQSVPILLMSLGRLAERGMLEQQVLFDEKTVYATVSDPAGSPFLRKFLFKRRIHKETMFSFMHLSFQEFFTALYYVLLDEKESQKKVQELLHTVERGWALSSWTDRDVSVADSKVSTSNWLQAVIPFLCGLCKMEWISTAVEKHTIAISIGIESQLKEWISQFSQRYQNEHMMFILHCLYELHDKSFVGKILEGLILIDLSKMSLKMTDCWVLKYCLQCCEHIQNLKLYVTSDNLKMLQPELCRCKELWLMMNHISDNDVGLVSAAGNRKNTLIIKCPENNRSFFCPESVSFRDGDITLSVCSSMSTEASLNTELTLTCPDSLISTIKWVTSQNCLALCKYRYFNRGEEEVCLLRHLQSVSDLKKVCLQVSNLTNILASYILDLIQSCPNLTVLSINFRTELNKEEIQPLKDSLKQRGWIMTVWWKSVFIQPDVEQFTKNILKIKRQMCDSKMESSDSLDSSLKSESYSAQSFSDNAEMFTPELIHRDEDKHKNTYRFLCPHAGQFCCSLTNLVFVMEGEGKMQYNIVSWDPHLLDGLGQMQPAGPLYNIKCSTGSVSQLHLPHCEIFSEENKDGLAVAHFSGGNIEMIQPLNVTGTHAIIDIGDLSLYGLIKKIFFGSPIAAQVLLFLRPVTIEQKEKILHVHLLPGNVPVSEHRIKQIRCRSITLAHIHEDRRILHVLTEMIERNIEYLSLKVQHWHQDKKYIETSSKCHLFPGREYSLCCQPDECQVQPESEMFEHNNFSENYHPMFEVFLDVNIREVRLGILDKTEGKKEVWNRRRIFLTAPSQVVDPPVHSRITEFLNRHRDKLIQNVSSVMVIADGLKSKNIIYREMYSKIHAAEPRQEKMRLLLDVLDSRGTYVQEEFYKLLKDTEPHVVDELV